MKKSKIISVSITDQAGQRMIHGELPSDVPLYRLIPALLRKMNLPDGNYQVQKEGARYISANETFLSSGIEDGDVLALIPDLTAGGCIPIFSYRDLQLSVALTKHRIGSETYHDLFGLLLYTDLDKAISTYLQNYVTHLYKMSGEKFWLCIVERPNNEWREFLQQDLGLKGVAQLQSNWPKDDQNAFYPLHPTDQVGIIKKFSAYFGVSQKQLPVMVVFSNLKEKKCLIMGLDKFINPEAKDFEGEYTRFFRLIFTASEKAAKKPETERLSEFSRQMRPYSRRKWFMPEPLKPKDLLVPAVEILMKLAIEQVR